VSLLAHFTSSLPMPLSESTVSKLADVIKPDIVQEIYDSEKYYDFMTELIGEALEKKLGKCDQDLFFDLGMCLMDRIELK
tara:strand:+ start:297 stop:536 length:240 start_codon:yes stop_codon:yes gene_type:complete